jgi:hypothetical protein
MTKPITANGRLQTVMRFAGAGDQLRRLGVAGYFAVGLLGGRGEPDGGCEGAVAKQQLGTALGDAGGLSSERLGEHVLETVARMLAHRFGERGRRQLPTARPDDVDRGAGREQVRRSVSRPRIAGSPRLAGGCVGAQLSDPASLTGLSKRSWPAVWKGPSEGGAKGGSGAASTWVV